MKIICVYDDYISLCEKINNETQIDPIIFIKPDTALSRNKDFYIPEFSNKIHCELGLVVKISKLGKYILEENSKNYYENIALGFDFTATDLHDNLKEKGLPWEKSKSFDNSVIISDFFPLKNINNEINFCAYKNISVFYEITLKNVFNVIDKLLSYISKYFTLRIGDLVFVKLPLEGVNISENDLLEADFNNNKVLNIKVF